MRSVAPAEPSFAGGSRGRRLHCLGKKKGAHGGSWFPPCAVRPFSYAFPMPKRPSRIDLLELDIDLRLADLWREAAEIDDWNLEVVAAFMRAAYGKGYCDALTEDSPGSLCEEHGYRVPARRATATPEA